MVVPPLPNLEIPQDFVSEVSFERLFEERPEPLLDLPKIAFPRRDIQKPKAMELPKQGLVGGKMRRKAGLPFKTGVHITEGDHRRNTRERRGKKEGKLVHEITNCLLAACRTFVDLGRQGILGDAQYLAKEVDLVLFRFEVSQVLVGQNEVEEDQPGAHELERVAFAVAQVLPVNLTVDHSGKEMEQRTSACLTAYTGVPLPDEFLSKRRRTFAEGATRKSAELPQGEVAGEYRHDVEKTGF